MPKGRQYGKYNNLRFPQQVNAVVTGGWNSRDQATGGPAGPDSKNLQFIADVARRWLEGNKTEEERAEERAAAELKRLNETKKRAERAKREAARMARQSVRDENIKNLLRDEDESKWDQILQKVHSPKLSGRQKERYKQEVRAEQPPPPPPEIITTPESRRKKLKHRLGNLISENSQNGGYRRRKRCKTKRCRKNRRRRSRRKTKRKRNKTQRRRKRGGTKKQKQKQQQKQGQGQGQLSKKESDQRAENEDWSPQIAESYERMQRYPENVKEDIKKAVAEGKFSKEYISFLKERYPGWSIEDILWNFQ